MNSKRTWHQCPQCKRAASVSDSGWIRLCWHYWADLQRSNPEVCAKLEPLYDTQYTIVSPTVVYVRKKRVQEVFAL